MSHTRLLANVAIHPHRRTSSSGMPVSALAARCRVGAAAAWPSVISSARPSSSRSSGRGVAARRRERLDGAADLEEDARSASGSGHLRRAPRRQVGLAGEIQVERLEPSGGRQQQRRARRSRSPRRTRRGPAPGRPAPVGTRRAGRPRPWPAARARRRTRRPGGWPARPPARARRGAPDRRSARRQRWRNAAAAASPPRACARPADRSSSAATSSLGPGVARARCQARRSGSVSGSVASARARCTRWRSSSAPSGRRRTGRAGGRTRRAPRP